MGQIISPAKAIENIWWKRPKAGRPFEVEKAVLIPKEGQHSKEDLLIMKLKGGGYACSRDLTKFAYLPGSYPWITPVLKALVALEAITQADMDAHMARVKEREAQQGLEHNAEWLWRSLTDAGLEPTEAQRQFVVDHASRRFLKENDLPLPPEPNPLDE